MTYDTATRSTVMFGGTNGNPSAGFDDTWILTAANGWTQLFPARFPSRRAGAMMAYDADTRTVMLFGGGNATENLNDTWIWDGENWSRAITRISPPARSSHGMAYNPITKTVLLFGGNGNDGVLSDTWEWTGKTRTWTQRFPATSPSARRTSIVFDAAIGRIVLFGGDNAAGDCCDTYYNDTWEWDGFNWVQQFPPAQPPARALPALGYDVKSSQVVMFGGYITPGVGLDDTWTWNGANWNELQTSRTPASRWAASMDYDPDLNGLLIFGGEVTGDPFTNDSWLLADRP